MKSNRKYILGVIGYGHMGSAISVGACRSEMIERYQVAVYDHSPRTKESCTLERFSLLPSVKEVAENCHFLLLSVTPQILDSVLNELKDCDIECLVTVIAGVKMEAYTKVLQKVPVIRAMPNMALSLAEGATALCKNEYCDADDYDFIYSLFNAMGVTRTISEEAMCDIIAVNGSTPAYFYYMVDCMVKDAMSRGIGEDDARALITQTMIGAGKLLQADANKPVEEFVDAVCTNGGTTIEAVRVLKKEERLMNLLHEASDACIERAKELGNKK